MNGILNSDWTEVLVGDGFHCQPDQADSNLVYIESQDGSLLRLNFTTHERANIVPEPKAGAEPYRFEWNAPIAISANDPKTVYFAAQYLFKSTDRGDTWTTISPDLTTGADRNKMSILGKLPQDYILSRNFGVSWYPCITRISESPVDANVVWVGTQDGYLQVTRDASFARIPKLRIFCSSEPSSEHIFRSIAESGGSRSAPTFLRCAWTISNPLQGPRPDCGDSRPFPMDSG